MKFQPQLKPDTFYQNDISVNIQPIVSFKSIKKGVPTYVFLKQLNLLLEHHYSDENFDVSTLCRKLCLCPMQVNRKVKRKTGLTPGKYILQFRLRKAMELLLNSEEQISAVAAKTGFSTQSVFTRAFKRSFGFPPGQVRKQNR